MVKGKAFHCTQDEQIHLFCYVIKNHSTTSFNNFHPARYFCLEYRLHTYTSTLDLSILQSNILILVWWILLILFVYFFWNLKYIYFLFFFLSSRLRTSTRLILEIHTIKSNYYYWHLSTWGLTLSSTTPALIIIVMIVIIIIIIISIIILIVIRCWG